MFGHPQISAKQSPTNAQNAQQQPSTIPGGARTKFVKKFQNNIHIIDDVDNNRSPYGGLFNIDGVNVNQNPNQALIQQKGEHQKVIQAQKKKDTNTIDQPVATNQKPAFKNSVRSKADIQNQEVPLAQTMNTAKIGKNVQGQQNFKQSQMVHQDTTKGKSVQQSHKSMDRRADNNNTQSSLIKRGPQTTTDFDIEYAKLIAKQFPIYDQKGKLIDYSNINEFQLELLALHEEYGEEKDQKVKMRIFQQLSVLNEVEFYDKKRQNKLKQQENARFNDGTDGGLGDEHKSGAKKTGGIFSKKTYGKNVGKEGGNPEYRKTVIQLENERIEKERLEILVKRKRNSNYIQQCIKHGNEHYDQQKLNALSWLKKPKAHDDTDNQTIQSKIDDKNIELLKKKQEILAKYNQFSKQNAPQFADDGVYRYSIVKGNNSKIVKQVLATRDWWAELEQQHNTLYQFKWAPVSRFINYEQLGAHGQKKVVNHIVNHDLLTTKDQIYVNMHKFCENQKLNVFQYLPIQFVLDLSAKNCVHEVDKFCQFFNSIEKVKKVNGYNNVGTQITQINSNLQSNKAIQAESKYKGLVNRKYEIDDIMYQGGNVWLIKPNDFNRGRGVKLFNTLEILRKLMKEFSNGNDQDFYIHNVCCQILANEKSLNHKNNSGKDEVEATPIIEPEGAVLKGKDGQQAENFLSQGVSSEVFVLQKYIESPLLIDERKFDIRLWVLVDCCDLKDQKCYLFKEGYIRTSSHKFTLSQESIDQPFIHLTNNAVQQYDNNYGKLEEGNQLDFKKASEMIKIQTGQDVDFYQILQGSILEIIKMTFRCVDNNRLNPNAKKHQFEIFGYDFMIDSELTPWLIEINTNPCLEETSKLLKTLLPRMLNDALKLTLDLQFPRPKEQSADPTQTIQQDEKSDPAKQFPVENYTNQENMWQHIYTLKPQ